MKKFEKNDFSLKKCKSSFGIKSSYSKSDLNDFCSKSLLANILNTDDDFGVIGKKINCFKSLNTDNFDATYEKTRHSLRKEQSLYNYQSSIKSDHHQRSNSSSAFEHCFTSIKNDVSSLKRNLNSILKELRLMTQKLREDESDEEKSLNWKFAAMVIDRLCMVFFTVTFLISTMLVLFTSENFFKSSNPNAKF